MTKQETIDNFRKVVKPVMQDILEQTNYEGRGKQDSFEFGRDMDIILDLAELALKERPSGRWINQSQGAKYPCECSECHTEPFCNDDGYVLSNFCPNCGADMSQYDHNLHDRAIADLSKCIDDMYDKLKGKNRTDTRGDRE